MINISEKISILGLSEIIKKKFPALHNYSYWDPCIFLKKQIMNENIENTNLEHSIIMNCEADTSNST